MSNETELRAQIERLRKRRTDAPEGSGAQHAADAALGKRIAELQRRIKIDKADEAVQTLSLMRFIVRDYGGNQAEFARANGVQRAQVTQWLVKNWVVVDGVLHSPRRRLR